MLWEDPSTVCGPSCADNCVLKGGGETDSNTDLAEHGLGAAPPGYYS